MKCEDLAGLLLPALRGTLSEPERAAMHEHVAECTSCAHDLPEMQTLWAALDEWVDEPAPEHVLDRVRAALSDSDERPEE